MAFFWSPRKVQAFVFYAARTANETYFVALRAANLAGVIATWYLTRVMVMTAACGVSVATRAGISQRTLSMIGLAAFAAAIPLHYFTLVHREQWRRFAHEFRRHTPDDLMFGTLGTVTLAGVWELILVFWAGDVTRPTWSAQ